MRDFFSQRDCDGAASASLSEPGESAPRASSATGPDSVAAAQPAIPISTAEPERGLLPALPSDLLVTLQTEVRSLAAHWLAKERAGHTLQPTAIVNEIWLRFAERSDLRFDAPEAFLSYVTEAIRSILIDHARRRLAARRGGGRRRVDFHGGSIADSVDDGHHRRGDQDRWARELVELDEELRLLAATNARVVRVFELRHFGGMTCEQIGRLLGVTGRTVQDDWRDARDWLGARLEMRLSD